MKFRTIRPGFSSEVVYEPKNRKQAEQIMQLHREMGDEIIILDDTDPEETSE